MAKSRGPSPALILYLASTLTLMTAASIAPALPAIEQHFAGGRAAALQLSLLITLPALMTAIAAPFCGLPTDRIGRRPVLIVALAFYAIAGSAGMLLDDLSSIILSRAFLGIAVAFVMTWALGLVADYFSGARRDQVIGRQAAFAAVGGILFPLAGGLLAEIRWRLAFLPFLLAAPLAFNTANSLPALPTRPTHSGRRPRVAWRGAVAPYLLAFAGMAAFDVFPRKIGFLFQETPQLTPAALAVPAADGISLGWLSFLAASASAFFKPIHGALGSKATVVAFWSLLGVDYLGIGLADAPLTLLLFNSLGGFGSGLLMPTVTQLVIDRATAEQRGALLGGPTTAIFAVQFTSQWIADVLLANFGVSACFIIIGAGSLAAALVIAAKNLRRAL